MHHFRFESAVDGRERDKTDARERGLGLDGLPEGEAFHVRQIDVEHDELMRLAIARGALQFGQRFRARGGECGGDARVRGIFVQRFSQKGVARHEEHAQVLQSHGRFGRRRRRRRGLYRDGEPESRAAAGFALETDLTAHHLHELLADGEAEAGAAEAARGGAVGLGERLENLFLLLGCDTDAGVAHFATQFEDAFAVGLDAHAQLHAAGFGELHGVADEVEQHLPQTSRIAAQRGGEVRGDEAGQFDLFGMRGGGEQLHGIFDDLADAEVDLLERQPAGFNLGEVKDVVEQLEQGVRAVAGGLGEIILLRLQFGGQQQIEHADDAVHRGADLVAHRGEELRLEPRALESLIACEGEIVLGVLERSDVARDADDAREVTGAIARGNFGDGGPDARAVQRRLLLDLVHHRLAGDDDAVLVLLELARTFERMEIVVGLADDIVRVLQADALGQRFVAKDETRVGVFEVDAVGHIVHQRPQQVTLEVEFLLQLLVFGDVPEHPLDADGFAFGVSQCGLDEPHVEVAAIGIGMSLECLIVDPAAHHALIVAPVFGS